MILNKYLSFLKFKKTPLIVNYHQIIPDTADSQQIKSSHSVSFDNFKSQIYWIKRHFNILPLDSLVKAHQKGRLKPYSAAITFDDGFKETFQTTSEFLKSNSLPASYFIIGCTLNLEAPYFDTLSFYNINKFAGDFLLKYYPDFYLSLLKFRKQIKNNPQFDLEYFNKCILEFNNINNLNPLITKYTREIYISSAQIASEKNSMINFGDHSFNHFNMANKTMDHKLPSLEVLLPKKAINYTDIFSLPFGGVNHLNPEILDKILKKYSAILLSPGNKLSKYFDYWKNNSSATLIPRFMPLDRPTII